ncbi:type IV secretion system protein VirB4, partial [Photobacterium iliopiscarium]
PLLDAVDKTAWHFYPEDMAQFEAIKTQYLQDKHANDD